MNDVSRGRQLRLSAAPGGESNGGDSNAKADGPIEAEPIEKDRRV
jgi:hypothetical protein